MSSTFLVLEDTIIHHNLKYENITPKGTIITDSRGKLLKAIDHTTNKLKFHHKLNFFWRSVRIFRNFFLS